MDKHLEINLIKFRNINFISLIYIMKKHMKSEDGKYHINGKVYDLLVGSRAQVYHDNAYRTNGYLTKDHLMMNKHGRIVSIKKHNTAKREKRLEKAGYFTRKGKFGAVHHNESKSKKHRKSHRKTH